MPFIKATQDRMVLEIQRGCIRGCRFCQAGMIYRPNREKKVDHLKDVAAALIKIQDTRRFFKLLKLIRLQGA